MDAKGYQAIFEQSSELLVVIDTDFAIVDASDAYLKVTKTIRENIIGRDIFDVFPDNSNDINAHGSRDIRASFHRVLKSKLVDRLAFVKYDIPKPASEGGGFVLKYWRPCHSPVLDEFNEVKYIIQRVEDVTENEALTAQLEVEKKALQRMKESEAFSSAILNSSPDCIKILNTEGRLEFMNSNGICLLEIDDFSKFKNRYWWDLWEDKHQQMIKDAITKALGGERVQFQALSNTAKGTPKWWDVTVFPIQVDGQSAKVQRIFSISRDITDHKAAMLKLEESEHRFQGAVAAVQGILWTNNAKGEMQGEQPGWAGLTGQKYEEYQGYGWSVAVHPDDAQPTVNAWNEAVAARKNFIFEHRLRLSNGNWGIFSVRATPLLNADGLVREWVGVHTDITEQRELEKAVQESEKHFRQMADMMPAKISNADPQGNVLYFNKKWLEYTGLSFEELKDLGYYKIIHPDELEEFQHRFQAAAETGTILGMEMRFLNKDGDYKWHLNLTSPVKDETGKISMWVGSTTDIHEQKEQKAALEQAVKERTKELEQANKELLLQNEEKEKRSAELSSANKELEAFVYISSHDLQEPLRKIQTFASRILDKENENLSGQGKDYFQRMQEAAGSMQQLIQDLLVYSRTNVIERKFEKTDLQEIIEAVKVDLQETIREKNATIDTCETCELQVIRDQFRQLMHNLIANALKFTLPEKSPHIRIQLRTDQGIAFNNRQLLPEKNYVHIAVSDNGLGFEPVYKDKIFEVFQRLHGRKEYGGTGIGLAIVKKIVENHHGFITATSELNKGATFDIYIPAGKLLL